MRGMGSQVHGVEDEHVHEEKGRFDSYGLNELRTLIILSAQL